MMCCYTQRPLPNSAMTYLLQWLIIVQQTRTKTKKKQQAWWEWMCETGWEKPTKHQPYTKNCMQLKKARSRRGGILQRRSHKLIAQGQMSSPEYMHTNNIMCKEQVIFRCVCVCMSLKEDKNMKKREERYMRRFEGRKER